jgi:hypothetical protein
MSEWVTEPVVLEILIKGRGIRVGDFVRWESNPGNNMHPSARQEVEVLASWHESIFRYYGTAHGLDGESYPSGWRLTGWRRPR